MVLNIWDRCIWIHAKGAWRFRSIWGPFPLCPVLLVLEPRVFGTGVEWRPSWNNYFWCPRRSGGKKNKEFKHGQRGQHPCFIAAPCFFREGYKKIAFLGPSTMLKLPLELFPIPTNVQKHVWPIHYKISYYTWNSKQPFINGCLVKHPFPM